MGAQIYKLNAALGKLDPCRRKNDATLLKNSGDLVKLKKLFISANPDAANW